MAYVAWIKSKKLLLKVQEGTGDNLLHEDIQRGYVDYVLWSTFQPDYLDIDEELTFSCIDSGMALYKQELIVDTFIQDTLPAAYEQAVEKPYLASDCELLWTENDTEQLTVLKYCNT